ncbi:hypothetical protein C7B67_26890 [filamentous cyanobacterium Phorm 6]|nr:hypothetical protein C7B67_26890 [filamentous cyanobacterium Phorm 6]
MPKVDRQGAKVRSAPAFVTFCGSKSSDAQQQPSSNRRIAGSQTPKLRNQVHCQSTISALAHSQAKHIRQSFWACNIPRGDNSLPGAIFVFCLSETFTSRTSNIKSLSIGIVNSS